jgi:hypothetical protein
MFMVLSEMDDDMRECCVFARSEILQASKNRDNDYAVSTSDGGRACWSEIRLVTTILVYY